MSLEPVPDHEGRRFTIGKPFPDEWFQALTYRCSRLVYNACNFADANCVCNSPLAHKRLMVITVPVVRSPSYGRISNAETSMTSGLYTDIGDEEIP